VADGFPLCLLYLRVYYVYLNKGQLFKEYYFTKQDDFIKMLGQLHMENMHRLVGMTAIFITDIYDRSGVVSYVFKN
jgi:KUP system potassium uptake protein